MLLDGDRDNVLPGVHVRTGEGHTFGSQFISLDTAKGRMVVAGDCIYGAGNILGKSNDGVYTPLGSAIGSAWEQLKSIDRINDEIAGDLDRLVILHDFDRWTRFEQTEGGRRLRHFPGGLVVGCSRALHADGLRHPSARDRRKRGRSSFHISLSFSWYGRTSR